MMIKAVSSKKHRPKSDKEILKHILAISEEIHNIADIDILLDKILFEVRRFTNAEGGTIYLLEDDLLRVNYVQNDILFAQNPASRYKYLRMGVGLDSGSIAGATVKQARMLEFKDVYKIGRASDCHFNKKPDLDSGYRTKSMISIPLKSLRNKVIGVMQVINAKDERGKVVPFSEQDKLFITYFANDAAVAIERARSTRQMILRMLRMVEFRDPKETGGHVNRMGTYAIEIYGKWAENREFPPELIRRYKDKLRIAAMLHDAGKIGISDQILKKPAKLDPQEYDTMKMHTVLGYRLFTTRDSEVDAMAAEIALSHHEKWDGTGYPGRVINPDQVDKLDGGPGRKQIEIPITGRIVAVADVYDALISKRVYKDAWDEGRVLQYIKDNAGSHFDPEVVEAFMEIYDVIKAIREQYKEDGNNQGHSFEATDHRPR